jgi:glutamate---cysteine ligase / carboxylate-amine ligase
VEEELFVVDARTRALVVDATPVLAAAGGQAEGYPSYADEFRLSMIESRTSPCLGLDRLRAEIGALRQGLVRAAAASGRRVVAAGSPPAADWRTQPVNPKPRFLEVAATYARLADEHVICGCHVHVGVDDRDTAVEVMNRVRPWLPVLLALSASSPFWMGEDTGYASYRNAVLSRWPMAGVPPLFTSFADYTRTVESLIATGVAIDARQAFWDVRPGISHHTIEFRIADSCTRVDETIAQAGLCRALVQVCLDEVADGVAAQEVRHELLRAATWRAARFGLGDRLLDPVSAALVPAAALVDRLVDHVRGPLEDAGDWEEVTTLVARIDKDGTSAERQRRAFAESDGLEGVVDLLVQETALA